MPAAAVIPAPRVYIKVVAVKKLVVDVRVKICSSESLKTLRLRLNILDSILST